MSCIQEFGITKIHSDSFDQRYYRDKNKKHLNNDRRTWSENDKKMHIRNNLSYSEICLRARFCKN